MLILVSIFIFSIASVFRLLDNSAGLLISKGIFVSPFYLKSTEIKKQMQQVADPSVLKKLNRALLFQKLHKFFLIISVLVFVMGIISEIRHPMLNIF